MEIGVDARRGMPYHDLIAEYRDVTKERLSRLADLEDTHLDEMGQGFFGPSKVRSLLAIRVFDLWAHEQDIRRALGEPGGFSGIPAAHSRERMLMGAGNNIQERLSPAAGTTRLRHHRRRAARSAPSSSTGSVVAPASTSPSFRRRRCGST